MTKSRQQIDEEIQHYENIVHKECEFLFDINDGDESSVSEDETRDDVSNESDYKEDETSIAKTRGRRNLPKIDYAKLGDV